MPGSKFLLLTIGFIANIAMAEECSSTDSGNYFKRHSLKETTARTIACDYQNEQKMTLYDGEIGLALSGGGTRAALFAHGIIQGLHDNGLLDKISIISSVSGGGYAAYWLIANSYQAQKESFKQQKIFEDCVPIWTTREGSDDRRILNNVPDMPRCLNNNYLLHKNPAYLQGDYRWQTNIATHPDLFRKTPTSVKGDTQKTNWLKLLEVVAKGTYDATVLSKVGGGLTGSMYEKGIQRVWGPLPEHAIQTVDLNWSELQADYNKHKLPFWILNSRHDQKSIENVDEERIYEITPYAHGSEELGYTTLPFPFKNISTAVRLSGAFVDYQGLTPDNRMGRFMKAMRLISSTTWGEEISVPNAQTNKKVRLSDGGGEENLGVISLIRRGVKNIIIADGSYDRSGTMEDLCRVKRILEKNAMQITFSSLPDLPDVCAGRKAYNISRWLNKVLTGNISWNNQQHEPIKVFYFKLGWNEPYFQRQLNAYHQKKIDAAEPAAAFLTFFYLNNASLRNKKDKNMYFPQINTANLTLNSSSYLFWGYRELGRYMARSLDANAINNSEKIKVCVQKADNLNAQIRRSEQTPVSRDDRMFSACLNGENVTLSTVKI